jgi:DNA (cytosine-5)-methyltransferase 1
VTCSDMGNGRDCVPYNAIDLFAGCGGMTEGLFQAGFRVLAAVELDKHAAKTYRANNDRRGVRLFERDIRTVDVSEIGELLGEEPLHLLAGCPPCQGFSAMRRRNRKGAVDDPRNKLICEYVRFVRALQPVVIMLENVPALADYPDFSRALEDMGNLGYDPQVEIVELGDYGVPQKRKRLIVIGSLLGTIRPAVGDGQLVTVRDAIGCLESVSCTKDPVHMMFPAHSPRVQERISLTPHDGGSRTDLPSSLQLRCHQRDNVGFKDVYGRLAWARVASTITGGCLNPSKGRFLHPEEDRCITAREAAMLQTFPRRYIFLGDVPRSATALMIGNALPPEFARRQAVHVSQHLDGYFMSDVFDNEKRSKIMKSVRNKGTTPELAVRKLLCEMGLGHYRLGSTLPCKPDIVFPGRKRAIFVNGCFWHGHDCPKGRLPETNREFWKSKIDTNRQRDERNYRALESLGWSCLVLWECQIRKSKRAELRTALEGFLSPID